MPAPRRVAVLEAQHADLEVDVRDLQPTDLRQPRTGLGSERADGGVQGRVSVGDQPADLCGGVEAELALALRPRFLSLSAYCSCCSLGSQRAAKAGRRAAAPCLKPPPYCPLATPIGYRLLEAERKRPSPGDRRALAPEAYAYRMRADACARRAAGLAFAFDPCGFDRLLNCRRSGST